LETRDRAARLDVDLFASALRVTFVLRAAGLLAGVFLFFDLAMMKKRLRWCGAKNEGA